MAESLSFRSCWMLKRRRRKLLKLSLLMPSEKANSQLDALTTELKRRDEDLQDLQEIAKGHESTISAKQQAIKDLDAKNAALVKARDASESNAAALKVEIDNLKSNLRTRDKERDDNVAERSKLQKLLDELRASMAAKTSEEVKLREAQRSREAEMADLRKEAAQHQRNLEEYQKTTAQAAGKLRVEIDNLRKRHMTAEKDLKTANETLKLKISEIEKLAASASIANKAQREAQAERDAAQSKLAETEQAVRDLTAERKVSQREDHTDTSNWSLLSKRRTPSSPTWRTLFSLLSTSVASFASAWRT